MSCDLVSTTRVELMSERTSPNVRTKNKNELHPIITQQIGLDCAIRAKTSSSLLTAREAVTEYLIDQGYKIIHETDVIDIGSEDDAHLSDLAVLKVGELEPYTQYQPHRTQVPLGRKAVKTGFAMPNPSASSAVNIDPSTPRFLPSNIAFYKHEETTHIVTVRPSTVLAVFGDNDINESVTDIENVLWNALETGCPNATMLKEKSPIKPDDARAQVKSEVNSLLSLKEAEYTIHFSTERSMHKTKHRLLDTLSSCGQRVLDKEGPLLLIDTPDQTHKSLNMEPDLTAFLPYGIFLFERDDRTHIQTIRPTGLLVFFNTPRLQDLLFEMEVLLWNAITDAVPDGRIELP